MAHELTRTNGSYEMAYVGETPWHGLGQALPVGADIETWQKAAGMEWQIRRTPVMYAPGRGKEDLLPFKSKEVLFRTDNGNPLGVVAPTYVIVQPSEMLEFFRDLVAGNGYQLETAGTLFGGTRFWALAKVTQARINTWDEVGGYVLISSTADGSRATEVRETTVRVVCNNTLSMALGATSKGKISINHRTLFDHDSIKDRLGLSRDNFENFMEAANSLSKVKVSMAAAVDFTDSLLRKVTNIDSEVTARIPRGLETILDLFNGAGKGSDLKGAAGTAWGLVNAVTEYVDHYATAKSVDHRMDRAFWGTGDILKTRAFELAQHL